MQNIRGPRKNKKAGLLRTEICFVLHIFKPFKGLDFCYCAPNIERRMHTGTESKTEVYQETEEKIPPNSLRKKEKRQCKIKAKAKVLLSRIRHLCAQQPQRLKTPPN